MKRNLFIGVFIILTFFLNDLFAQVIPPESIRNPRKGGISTSSPTSSKKAKKPKAPKGGDGEVSDVVTLNLTSLSLANLSLRFEHQLKGKLSVGLGAGYLLTGILPSVAPYDMAFTTNDVGIQPASGEFSGFNATPEIRFYPFSKRRAPYGFYLGLFGRYFNFDWKVPYISIDAGTQEKLTANGNFGISGMGGGANLGIQFIFKDRVVLDWFVGGGLASSTLKGEVSSPDIVDDLAYYEEIGIDLKAFSGDVPVFDSESLMVDFEKAKASFEFKGAFLPIIRTGLAIGIAF